MTNFDAQTSADVNLSPAVLDEASRLKGINDTASLQASVHLGRMEMEECLNVTNLCIMLSDDESGSYEESYIPDNFLCINISANKVCDPRE